MRFREASIVIVLELELVLEFSFRAKYHKATKISTRTRKKRFRPGSTNNFGPTTRAITRTTWGPRQEP